VSAGPGDESTALEAGYLVCAMTYLGEQVEAVSISTVHGGPHLWSWDGLNDYETAAKTFLCPR
jgi:hypothetical protein